MSRSGEVLELDISGIRVRLAGPDRAVLQRFREGWAAFVSPEGPPPDLDLSFRVEGAPPPDQSSLRKLLQVRTGDGQAALTTGEGRVTLEDGGRAEAVVRNGGERFRFYGLQNLLLAALARLLPGRGMILVHGAGIVLDGAAVVLVGPEGAGKTTWSRLAGQAGAGILSDDLLILAARQDGILALGSPFRQDRTEPLGPGRWPLGLLLAARHAATPELLPGSRLAFQALLSANLPFVADRAVADPDLHQVVDDILDRVPGRVLAFPPSPSFVPLLRQALAAGKRQ